MTEYVKKNREALSPGKKEEVREIDRTQREKARKALSPGKKEEIREIERT